VSMQTSYLAARTDNLRRNSPTLWLLQSIVVVTYFVALAAIATVTALVYPVRPTYIPRVEPIVFTFIMISGFATARWLYLVSQPIKWPHLRTFDHEPSFAAVAVYCAMLLAPPYIFGGVLETRIIAVIDPSQAVVLKFLVRQEASNRNLVNDLTLAPLARFETVPAAFQGEHKIDGLIGMRDKNLFWYSYDTGQFSHGNVLGETVAVFNFQQDQHDRALETINIYLDPDRVFATSVALDCTIVSLMGSERNLQQWGSLTIRERPEIDNGALVSVIQHPDGAYKQISLLGGIRSQQDDYRIFYETSTMPGSSGAPVFDEDWKVVALHRGAGSWCPNEKRYCNNVGIRFAAICQAQDLKRFVRLPEAP